MRSDLRGELSKALPALGAATLLYFEHRRPLRRAVQSKIRRTAQNLAVAAGAALVVRLIEDPLASRLAIAVRRRRFGLLQWTKLPPALEVTVGVLLLDYTLYHWHRLTHLVPFLWRFHAVHHLDRDLDASTGLRFHFGEMLLSVPYRMAQVVVLGPSPEALHLWKRLLFTSVLFHHSNVRLPQAVERRLSALVVTPRMHGIHHSEVQAERNSNWSSFISWWDWLHRTLRADVPQDQITIGLGAPEDACVYLEGNWYFPKEAVPQEHLRPTETHTICPWKGVASYFDVVVDGQVNHDAAWIYPAPLSAADPIAGRIAFWRGVEVEP